MHLRGSLRSRFFAVRLPSVQGRLARLFSFLFCLRLREISCSIAVGLGKSFRVESDRVGARGNFHVYFVVFFMIPHFAG